jgi:hypothetical protein
MHQTPPTSARWRAGGSLAPVLWVAAGLASALPAAETAEPKTHVLFMGTDIDVQLNQKEYRVKNVAGYSFVINVDGKPVEVATNRGPIALKVIPSLKLSDRAATVAALSFERAYTPENDPTLKWQARQSLGSGQAAVGTAAGKWANAMMGANQAIARQSPGVPQALNEAAQAGQVYHQAQKSALSDFDSPGQAAAELQTELDQQLFDAVRVTCEISAPRPMNDPYLVIITQYREKDDPPGAVKNWVYAWQLDRLDETPLKVRILKGGFPPGFELLKQQLHVYGAGRELGTNVADKNVPLTRDEAHEYIVIDHLVTHKKATLPPSVALGVSSKDFYPHFGAEQVQQVIYVKVDKDGLPGGAFRNERCTEPSGDDYLEKLVGRTRFKPAIKEGKPVEGVARLKIVELARGSG